MMLNWGLTCCRICRPRLNNIVKKTLSYRNPVVWRRQNCTIKHLHSALALSTSNTEIVFSNDAFQEYLSSMVKEYHHTLKKFNETVANNNMTDVKSLNDKLLHIKEVAECVELLDQKKQELLELDRLINDKTTDKDMIQLAQEDKISCLHTVQELKEKIIDLLVPPDVMSHNNVVLEVTAGVGGQEAMLFTKDLFTMYVNYVTWKGWHYHILEEQASESGGLRQASMSINGSEAFSYLKFEGGVHRVQRIPETEKSGRIHTSTATVAVLPQPTEIAEDINMKDVKIETKRSSGAGGQHVNKTESAVRLTHLPTGIVVECQTERSQIQNKTTALKKLRAKLYQLQYETLLNQQQKSRKLQIGTSGRSEKIRTYNFPQDRITDHRLSQNFHHIVDFLQGNEVLHKMILCLSAELKKEILMEVVAESGRKNVNKI